MDLILRQPVHGTWAQRKAPAGDHHGRAKDPRGWQSHHLGFAQRQAIPERQAAHKDAVRRLAFEFYLDRLRSGRPGSREGDWEDAERALSERNEL
mgnify:CR=1 FL=1